MVDEKQKASKEPTRMADEEVRKSNQAALDRMAKEAAAENNAGAQYEADFAAAEERRLNQTKPKA